MTLLIAHVLPDRRSGFVAVDTRYAEIEEAPDGGPPRHYDLGGKLFSAPHGWASLAGNDPAALNAARTGLLAAHEWPPMQRVVPLRERLVLLERVIGVGPMPDASPTEGRAATTVVLEACTEGLGLFVLDDARGGRTTWFYANLVDDRGPETQTALGRDLLDGLLRAPFDLASRIVEAARHATRSTSRLKSEQLNIGYAYYTPSADDRPPCLRKGSIDARAADIAACAPEELFGRFPSVPRSFVELTLGRRSPA